MAWTDVPAKITEYGAHPRAVDDAQERLLREFGVDTNGASITDGLAELPGHRREDFEAALDYRLGACKNGAASKVWRK